MLSTPGTVRCGGGVAFGLTDTSALLRTLFSMAKRESSESSAASKKANRRAPRAANEFTSLRDLLGITPEQIEVPLPALPTSPDQLAEFMDAYRVRLELVQAAVGVDQLQLERDRYALERERLGLEMAKLRMENETLEAARRKGEVDLRRAELELAAAERDSCRAMATPEQTLVYCFFNDVSEVTVRDAVGTLDQWSRMHPGAPMEIQLASPGGSVLDGLALFDFILSLRRRGHHVTTTALGYAASMASIILQAGDRRVAGVSSFVMIHEVAYGWRGKVSEHEDEVAFTRRLQERLIAILCERSELTPAKVRAMWRKKDVWLDAQESLRIGLVDEVAS
jgi:ATP-dependent Clp protease, protease subunit